MKYTISKKADEKVQKDLDVIKKILVKKFNPKSIILFGGFGRGEGSFEIQNGKILPLNDYDMYIVTEKNIPSKILDEAGKECSRAIGRGGGEFVEESSKIYNKNKFFHVDLRCLVYSDLGRMKRINRTYELKHASTVIYGEDARKKINDIIIPLSESFRYLLNPACHLLLCMDSRRFNGKFIEDEKSYVVHHIIKTYLACASSLLISEGLFPPTYTKTAREFKRVYGKRFPELAKRVEEAAEEKVMPRKKDAGNIKERWLEARDWLLFCLKYIAKKHLGIEAENVDELAYKIYSKLPYTYFEPYLPFGFFSRYAFLSQYALNLLYAVRSRKLKVLLGWKDVGLKIGMSAFVLLNAVDNEQLLNPAYNLISSFASPKSSSWSDLREALLFGFDRYFSQKLI